MRVCFFSSEKARERLLADAFMRGVIEHGDDAFMRPLGDEGNTTIEAECFVMVGVKSRELFHAHWSRGAHVIMLDKGYVRHSGPGPIPTWEYWRVSVDAHHPTQYLMDTARPSDRFDRLNLEVQPWRTKGKQVVIAGSSAKYHAFYDLKDPTTFAKQIIKELLPRGRPIIYRPKPSWKEAVEIKGSIFSRGKESIMDVLAGAHALVTHGSNATFEAMLAGIPSIVLGEAVAKPISSTSLTEIEDPRIASDEERLQLLHNLAYCQWRMSEFASGEAWSFIRPVLFR